MVLVRVGGPLWLGVIVTLWGVVATCFAGLSSAGGFYALRLLLGLAEAGTFPGLWYMLTQFYTTPEVTAYEGTHVYLKHDDVIPGLWYMLLQYCTAHEVQRRAATAQT